MKNELTYQYLSELFEIVAETGVLRWRSRVDDHFSDKHAAKRWNARYANTSAGSLDAHGYVRVRIGGLSYAAHRIIFALNEGVGLEQVPNVIDHIDGDPSNNRPSNLRSASYRNNAYNRLANSAKYGGCKGAYYDPRSGNWAARIMAPSGAQISLGIFNTKEEAAAAYIGAAIIIQGEFFRDPRDVSQAAA